MKTVMTMVLHGQSSRTAILLNGLQDKTVLLTAKWSWWFYTTWSKYSMVAEKSDLFSGIPWQLGKLYLLVKIMWYVWKLRNSYNMAFRVRLFCWQNKCVVGWRHIVYWEDEQITMLPNTDNVCALCECCCFYSHLTCGGSITANRQHDVHRTTQQQQPIHTWNRDGKRTAVKFTQ